MGRENLPTLSSLAFETAAEHVTARVPLASPGATASEIRRSLEGCRFDTAAEIAICDHGRLVGLLNVEDLLAAPEGALARELMDSDPPVVAPGTDQEVAAWEAVRRGESSLAVVDEDRCFLGLIPPQRLLSVLFSEHEEDMARLGGYVRDTASARSASEEPVAQRFRHRLPWLLVGLVGAIISADIVGQFKDQLEERVILAFFVPAVVYLADAVGTQTEALVIRGLAVGVPIGRVLWRELLTGILAGGALAAAFLPVALLRWGQADVAVSVALSLLAGCSISTLVAMALPWMFLRLGSDPAFGSGPLATVLQNLLSIVLYFAISLALVSPGR